MSFSAEFHLQAQLEQNPVSHRRLARDIAEMVNTPYPRTRLIIPNKDNLTEACLLLDIGSRIIHVAVGFTPAYPQDPPLFDIGGRVSAYQQLGDDLCCADILATLQEGTQAYTLKTFAMHLLSMFDGDLERKAVNETEETWVPTVWKDFKCHDCGYPQSASNAFNTSVQHPRPYKEKQSRGIRDLPDEILLEILEYLDAEDLLYFGHAWEKVKGIIEGDEKFHGRDIQCFVTKEHYSQSPLGIGINFPRWWPRSETPKLESEFDLVSSDAFSDLRVRTSAYGCGYRRWLPLPLSESHWKLVKEETYDVLDWLSRRVLGRFQWNPMIDDLDVVICLMDEHIINLFTCPKKRPVTSLLQVSEKGIESVFFLFHLLLCLAVDIPEYVEKANNMVKEARAHKSRAKDMPSPGRILAATLISDVETNAEFLSNLFLETVTRNVPKLLKRRPELGYQEKDNEAWAYRLYHTFKAHSASYRALMFMNFFQQTVRPANTGRTIEETRNDLFRRRGFPPAATLATLAAEMRRIKAIDSFQGFVSYLNIHIPHPDERYLAEILRGTVRECINNRDLVPRTIMNDEAAARRREEAEEESLLAETGEDGPAYPELPDGYTREYFASRIFYG